MCGWVAGVLVTPHWGHLVFSQTQTSGCMHELVNVFYTSLQSRQTPSVALRHLPCSEHRADRYYVRRKDVVKRCLQFVVLADDDAVTLRVQSKAVSCSCSVLLYVHRDRTD